jgi:hypothetical protein
MAQTESKHCPKPDLILDLGHKDNCRHQIQNGYADAMTIKEYHNLFISDAGLCRH